MDEKVATLEIEGDHYSIFRVGELAIRFYTSPYLKEYCSIDKWEDTGYIEYTGLLSTYPDPIEDSIDLGYIAKRLHLRSDVFKGIKEVKII